MRMMNSDPSHMRASMDILEHAMQPYRTTSLEFSVSHQESYLQLDMVTVYTQFMYSKIQTVEFRKSLLILKGTRINMHLTKEFINNELYKAQQLLWSGSLDQVDQAHNIVASLLNDLQRAKIS